MSRTLFFATLVGLSGCLFLTDIARSEEPAGPFAALATELKKGDKEKLAALDKLDALGDKAASLAPAVIELLRTKNEDIRLRATILLGNFGPAAVTPLVATLADQDPDVRFYGVWGLAFVGPPAKNATPSVIKALSDSSPSVRRKAAYALSRIEPDPAAAVDVLVAALGDENIDVRHAAGAALPSQGKAAVPALIKVMNEGKPEVRTVAIKTLGDIGAGAEAAIPSLKTLLHTPDNAFANQAAAALANMGSVALPILVAAASDEKPGVRQLALSSLQTMGVTAVPALVDLLGAKHVDARRQAANLLGSIPVNDKMVVIGLGFATKDTDFQTRQAALQAIRNRGPLAKLAEPYVSSLLTDIDPQIRVLAFHTLQELGTDPQPGLKKALSHEDAAIRINTASLMASLNLEIALAEPILLEGLKQTNQALKMQAASALSLRGLQPDVVMPIFVAGLKNEVASVRRQAAEALGRYGVKAKPAAPALIATLDDPEESVSGQALASLRQLREEPKVMLPALVKVLRRKETGLHVAAAQAFFQVGPDAVPELVNLLKTDDTPAVRLACLQTLAMVGPPAKAAVAELIKALDDPAPRSRMTAARALGNIGPDASAAEAALTKATKDADTNVQKIANAALVQVRADGKQAGFQVQGILTSGDPIDPVRPGHFHVIHTFPMKAGQSYTINLNSPWDNFLRLESPQGQQVAMDDDSGGNLMARIIHTANTDGWYRIIVTTFAPNATGNYTLRVK